jgi:serine/threonine protein kinase
LLGEEIVTRASFNNIRIIGHGAFAKVFLVEKRNNKKLYALKEQRIKKDDSYIKHIKSERQLLE